MRAKNRSYQKKRMMIIIAIIAVLAIAATIGTVAYVQGNRRATAATPDVVSDVESTENGSNNNQPTEIPQLGDETETPTIGEGTATTTATRTTRAVATDGDDTTTPSEEYTQITIIPEGGEEVLVAEREERSWTPIGVDRVNAVTELGTGVPELESTKIAYVNEDKDLTDAKVGDTITYEISVTNTSESTVKNIYVYDTVPEGTELKTDSVSNEGKVKDNNITWKIEEIDAGEEVIVSFEVTVLDSNKNAIMNIAIVNGEETGETETNLVTDFTVEKIWDDADDQDEMRPTELTVTLSDGQTATLNAANGWTYTWDNLPLNENNQRIEYTVSEGTIEGYELISNVTEGNKATLTNKHELLPRTSVTVNRKVLTSITEESTEEMAKLDVVFVLDFSASMRESMRYTDSNGETQFTTRAEAMIDATNAAIAELLAEPEDENVENNNRVGVVYYNKDGGTILNLGKYTPKSHGEYLKINNMSSSRGELMTNVHETDNTKHFSFEYSTYMQRGIQLGADMLYNSSKDESDSSKSERTPVLILLTDGIPNYGHTAYDNVVSNWDVGDANNDNAEVAYLTVLSANYYKDKMRSAYDGKGKFYTIGFGNDFGTADIANPELANYHKAILNPTSANMELCKNGETYGKKFYKYLVTDKQAEITRNPISLGRMVVTNPYENFSYADKSWARQMSPDDLKDIMHTINQEIIKNYTLYTDTQTMAINSNTEPLELTNLDTAKKITIKVDDGEEIEEIFANLPSEMTSIVNGKHYINLQYFAGAETVEITYYEKDNFLGRSFRKVVNNSYIIEENNIQESDDIEVEDDELIEDFGTLRRTLSIIDLGKGNELIEKAESTVVEIIEEQDIEISEEIQEDINEIEEIEEIEDIETIEDTTVEEEIEVEIIEEPIVEIEVISEE